MEGIDYN